MHDPFEIAFYTGLGAVLLLLALPPALAAGSWRMLGRAVLVSVFGVMGPLAVFGMASVFTPDWKGGARLGWIDSFHTGKLALTPIALWASAALYTLELGIVTNRQGGFLRGGIWNGALISLVCLVHGVATIRAGNRVGLGLLIPLYVTLWYCARAAQQLRQVASGSLHQLYALLAALPFWIASLILSWRTHAALPDEPPSCFVVTAASHGHPALVGRAQTCLRRGRLRRANRQLQTFWQLEDLWAAAAGGSHARFRQAYAVWGPRLARHLANPWAADTAFILLKPVEIVARLLVALLPTA